MNLTLSPKNRSRHTSGNAVWFILLVVVVVGAAAALQTWGRTHTHCTTGNSCINNLRHIGGGIQQWALENHKTTNDVPHWQDIRPYINLTSAGQPPSCPDGGKYTLGRVGDRPACSIPGHKIP